MDDKTKAAYIAAGADPVLIGKMFGGAVSSNKPQPAPEPAPAPAPKAKAVKKPARKAR